MTALHKDFINAILRSLRRGKSLLHAILRFFHKSPSTSASQKPMAQTTTTIAKESKSADVSLIPTQKSPRPDGASSSSTAVGESQLEYVKSLRNLDDFLCEAEALFLNHTNEKELLALAEGFKEQFMSALEMGKISMLPSYSYRLPSGSESGRYLAADMGGSNLRVALIELSGRSNRNPADDTESTKDAKIVVMKNFRVDDNVRGLVGMSFFEWMAGRISETLESSPQISMDSGSTSSPLPLSLAWSFPIDQTSLGSGRLLDMGKGLKAVEGLLGQDIGHVIKTACASQGLCIELRAILNDSTACLLSQSYTHLSTRMGLILGTGTNIAAFLPVGAVGKHKFGNRSSSWWDAAAQVVVNTEVSTVGKGVLPMTRWDDELNAAHDKPDFQPLEMMVSGMYLGEICRRVIIDAVENAGLFGGELPHDISEDLSQSISMWKTQHPSTYQPTTSDIQAIRTIASFVVRRSSALVAASVYALWDLRTMLSRQHAASFPEGDPRRQELECEAALGETSVAFNGSVIEKYPQYLENCSAVLNRLVAASRTRADEPAKSVTLVMARESSLFGAAIALACEEH
ncbi:hypothetical protein TD95_003954 [Thielaviopsis punctulata]|uniref:Phosphotransferase n=1 Tax=Thielaviopsis punctulata TaxID=72032 RepID=A0A0F4Z928_9PEZI|nr:hypothetical protein TD95_003954 [Thielaviopsis punctulata]